MGRKLSAERMWQCRSNGEFYEMFAEIGFARKIHDPVIVRARGELGGVAFGDAFDQNALAAADHVRADGLTACFDFSLEPVQPVELDVRRSRIGELGRRRSRPRAVEEAEARIESH